ERPDRGPVFRARLPDFPDCGREYGSAAAAPGRAEGALMLLHNPFTSTEAALIWLGALATLSLYSILYKENPVYRLAEHVFLGLAGGYGLFVAWGEILLPKWYTPLFKEGQWVWSLAVIAALMYFTVFSKRFSWMSRLIMTLMMGLKAGLEFRKWMGKYPKQI